MEIKEISDFELFLNKKNLEILREISTHEITEANVDFIIRTLDLLFIYFINSKYYTSFDKLFRLTVNRNVIGENRRLKNISNLKYPPNKKLIKKYGRCNLPGQSILYASTMSMTALEEMRPKAGDLITESIWIKTSKKKLEIMPIFSNQPFKKINPHTGEILDMINLRTDGINQRFFKEISNLPKNIKELSILVVQFISDFFAKRIDSNNHFSYVFSAYFADKFFNEVDGGKIDAIYYPSVANGLNSENLAIKPIVFDSLYKPFGVTESVVLVDSSQSNGVYQTDPICSTTDFNISTGEIIWSQEKSDDALFKMLNKH